MTEHEMTVTRTWLQYHRVNKGRYFAFTNATDNIVSNKNLWHLGLAIFSTPFDKYFCENDGSFIS